MKFFGIPFQRRQAHYLLIDVVVALLAIPFGHGVHLGWKALSSGFVGIMGHSNMAPFSFVITSLTTLYLADAYNPKIDFRRGFQISRLWSAVALALPLQFLAFSLFPHGWWGRNEAIWISLAFGTVLVMSRAALCSLGGRPAFRQRTLIVGAGDAGHILTREIRAQGAEAPFDLIGLVNHTSTGHRRSDHLDDPPSPKGAMIAPLLGVDTDLLAIVKKHHPDLIVVALRGPMPALLCHQLLECKAHGVQIEDMPSVHKKLTGKVPVLFLTDEWLIFGPVFSGSSAFSTALQRVADVGISLVGGVLSLLLVVPAAILIKLESPGGVFYTQERLGKDEVPFPIIKLRTMRDDAEAGGPQWSKGAGDPRVTRIGRWLRRLRIDELPQFWNVLRGDMSIVGPRPEREHFVTKLKEKIPFYTLRFAVKPGVTGWAQVRYRYGATDEDAAEKLCYELYAIQEMNVALYLLILLKTVQTVLLRPGS